MKKESEGQCCGEKIVVNKCGCKHRVSDSCGGSIYGLGVVGALFYFLPGAATLGAVLWGIGKSVFWPALIIYKTLQMLGI